VVERAVSDAFDSDELAGRVDPSTTALIVIDVQNDFCAPDGFFDRIGHDLTAIHAAVDRFVELIPVARAAGLRIIFVRGIYDEHYLSPAMIARHRRMDYPVEHCLEGTWGADFFRVRPDPAAGDLVVSKHRYSAFIDTDLPAILRANGIENLVVGGVATNVCVESTARDAYMHDYHVVFLADCSATYDRALHESTLENIRRSFGIVATSDEVVRIWAGGSGARGATGAVPALPG
jgi:ureidoacrylate peracid hydrolase